MANRFDIDDDRRKSDLIRILEHSIESLSLPELESIYYDMISKGYIATDGSNGRHHSG